MRLQWVVSPGWFAPFAAVLAIVPAALASGLPDQSRLPELQRSLRAREYHASPNSEGLQAPNRAHNFRTYFGETGVRLVDRTAPGSPEIARVSLAGIGRGSAVPTEPPQAAGPFTAAGNRIDRDRPGAQEWFLNSEAGLLHGLRLTAKPPGQGPVRVRLALAGASATRAQDGVDMLGGGRRLRFTRLPVTDVDGRLLASRLEVAGPAEVRLVIDDAAAIYPITAELLLTGTAENSVETNQTDAFLGWSVSAAGDVNGDGYADLIVGAFRYDNGHTDEGAAFVFHGGPGGVGDGDPASADALLESDQTSARMGLSVSGAGDVNGDGYDDVIVGMFQWENDAVNQQDEGGALVFHGGPAGVGDGSPANAETLLQGDQAFALFGQSVAGVGDVNGDGYADVVVGAPLYDLGQTDEGAASLFLGSASGIPDGSVFASDAFTVLKNLGGANVGASVAAAGDVNGDGFADILIGAPYWESAGRTDEGAAFVYLGDSTPTNLATVTTLRSDQDFAYAGSSVAGGGDVNGDGYSDVIVGMPNYDNGQSEEGVAMIFHGAFGSMPSGTPATAATGIQSNQGGAALGSSVAMIGDTDGDGYTDVAVGAPLYDGEGAVFVFLGHSGEMPPGRPGNAAATLQGSQAAARFGGGVGGAGDVNGDGYSDLVAGAPEWTNGHSREGAVFVYHGAAAGVDSVGAADAATSLQSTQNGDALGFSVAGAGDVNGDGWGDIIVGATGWDDGQAGEGAAFVFQGGPGGIPSGDLTTTPASTLEGDQNNANFGSSVAAAGDVNGDGYGDVIVSARLYDHGQADEGAAFVFHGGAGGVLDSNALAADAILESNIASSGFGESVAGVGDVNGDGYADVAVGSPYYPVGGGMAVVFHGSAAGVADGSPTTAAAVIESDQAGGSYLGTDVAGAGDVNGDGYADLIVGARGYSGDQSQEGKAFVFHGGAAGIASGTPVDASAVLEADQEGALFGCSVASAGDVNGDGYADVVVGAQFYADGESMEGAAFVHMGGIDGVSPTAASALQSDQAGAGFGVSVAGAGDVNGDGFADVIVGAQTYIDGEDDEGAAFVFHGSPWGIASGGAAVADATLQGDIVDARFGASVAGAGDVNGDGYADVLVGAYIEDSSAGAAYVFAGNGNGDGRPVLPRQLRGDGSSVPVQPWGGTITPEQFQVMLNNSHPAGRGRLKLEVEVCPAVIPFGYAGCTRQVSATWSDSYTLGLALTETIGDLPPGLLRWRARTLRAPFRVTEAGITAPANPAHGPWRRYLGQAFEADLRTPQGLFYTLAPCRIVDTRAGSGAPIGVPSLSSGGERALILRGECGVSDYAVAVSVNLTVVSPTAAGSLVFYANSGQVPNASNISFGSGQTRANNAILGLDAQGLVRVLATMNPGTVDLLVDVNGEFR